MKSQFLFLLILLFTTTAESQNVNRGGRFSDWSAPVNVGAPINSTASENSAVLSKNGLTLYFTSNRTGSVGDEDIWVSTRRNKNAAWETPVNLGSVVNSTSLDRLRSISPDGRVLLFQSSRTGSIGGNDIWASVRKHINDDFDWSAPINLGAVVNTNANEIAANYLFDNFGLSKKLFFSSSRAGGFGDADIYLSEAFFDGGFGQPMNVAELNSGFNESCIWVREDGLEIFFSSTRAALNNNVDSFDLWTATRESVFDNWSPPTRLAFNTPDKRDVGPNLSSDGETLYFTSTRDGGLGGTDIYVTTRRRLRGNE